MKKFLPIIILTSFMTTACQSEEIKIDGSSADTAKKTLKIMEESIPAEKREEFIKAYQAVVLSTVDFSQMLKNPELVNEEDVKNKALKIVDGLTAEDIIVKAKSLNKEKNRKNKQREEIKKSDRIKELEEKISNFDKQNVYLKEIKDLNKSINELEEQKKLAESDKEKLKQFMISDLSFKFKRKEDYAYISLKVNNKTKHPISRVLIYGKFISPERSVPWSEIRLQKRIDGGLEPNEQQIWEIGGYEHNIPKDKKEGVKFIITELNIYGPGTNDEQFGAKFESYKQEELKRTKEKLIEYTEKSNNELEQYKKELKAIQVKSN